MTRVQILDSGVVAGVLEYNGEKYIFTYDDEFLKAKDTTAISLALPKQNEAFVSNELHPFFSGLLAEGSLKELQTKKLKIDENDDFTRLIHTATNDTIGTITVGEIL